MTFSATSPGRLEKQQKSKPNSFFNAIIAEKSLARSSMSYYFVVNYVPTTEKLSIVHLQPAGSWESGKREGRVKWSAVTSRPKNSKKLGLEFDGNGVAVVSKRQWERIPMESVVNTCYVDTEVFDILEEDSSV